MELRDIQYIMHVATHGKINRAAEALGITQPALTKALARIERELGARLFVREPRGVALTPVGDIFMRHARRLHYSLAEVKREVGEFVGGTAGHLNVGVAPAISDTCFVKACLSLLSTAPQATMRIVTGMNDMLIPAVRSGELDLAISGVADQPPPGLAQEVFAHENFFPVVGRSHPLFRRRKAVGLDRLGKLRWVLSPAGVLSRQALNRAFVEAGLPPPSAIVEANSVSTMLSLVCESDFIGFVPQSALRTAGRIKSLSVVNPTAPMWRRAIGVTYRAHAYISPLAYKLVAILRRDMKAQHMAGPDAE